MHTATGRTAAATTPGRCRLLFGLRLPGLPVLVLLAAVLADVLFFRQWVGWTLGGFFAVVGGLLMARHARGLAFRAGWVRAGVLGVLLLGLAVSMVVEPGVLAFVLVLLLAGFIVVEARVGGAGRTLGWAWLGRFFLMWGSLWARPIQDWLVARRWVGRRGKEVLAKGVGFLKLLFLVAGVVVPAVLGLVFLGLFASANPVIARWLGDFFEAAWEVVQNITDYITLGRVFLWGVVVFGVWGVLRYRGWPSRGRYKRQGPSRPAPAYLGAQPTWGQTPQGGAAATPPRVPPTPSGAPAPSGPHAAPGAQVPPRPAPQPSGPRPAAPRPAPDSVGGVNWLTRQAVGLAVKTLVVLNVVFLAQLVLDARYLVLGRALPEGMTYAEYAHRGAYPLVVTALLAGGLVLAVFRPGGAAERSAWARWLVLFWIVQNVVLMLTAAWRLGMYVEVYALTRLRVAAGVWMLMVAGGLVLLLWRIARRRDNAWLSGATVVWGFAVLYLCCFVPFDPFIASYNADRCEEVGGPAGPIDVAYLETLGPDALPAIDRLLAQVPAEELDQPSAFRAASVEMGGRRVRGNTAVAYSREGEVLSLREALQAVRAGAAEELDSRLSGWRGWTARRAWLASGVD